MASRLKVLVVVAAKQRRSKRLAVKRLAVGGG